MVRFINDRHPCRKFSKLHSDIPENSSRKLFTCAGLECSWGEAMG